MPGYRLFVMVAHCYEKESHFLCGLIWQIWLLSLMSLKKKKIVFWIDYLQSLRKLEIRSLSVSYTCLGESSFSNLWAGGCRVRENTVAQQLLELWRGSISVNVVWHSTQRQPCGADDSVKPCLWRLHAWCCRAVIWSSHAKADRQTALSQAVSHWVSQSFHRDDNTSVSLKSVQ